MHFVCCNSFIYDRIAFILLQNTWNTFTLSNIYILMHNNTFAADIFLKTCNFHCTRRSKIYNFKYCKSSISWKLQKRSQSARTWSDCSYVLPDHESVCHAQAETSESLLSEFTYPRPNPPPPLSLLPPLKNMDHRKYAENLIFQSRFSCWFWELFELLMALE